VVALGWGTLHPFLIHPPIILLKCINGSTKLPQGSRAFFTKRQRLA
jgi:hypothetical protein